jgi:hypothetical protein
MVVRCTAVCMLSERLIAIATADVFLMTYQFALAEHCRGKLDSLFDGDSNESS